MNSHIKSLKSRKGFTLIEVSMAIALVAIGLTVGVLGYNGYQSWAQGNANAENARNLVSAVAQYKALGGALPALVTGFPASDGTVDRNEAQAIYAVIALAGDLPSGVSVVPAGFQLSTNAAFPSTFESRRATTSFIGP